MRSNISQFSWTECFVLGALLGIAFGLGHGFGMKHGLEYVHPEGLTQQERELVP